MTVPAPTLEVECALAAARGPGRRIVVGVDEVGRGALAGPVAVGACAIVVEDGTAAPLPEGVRDSKKLTARRREALVAPIHDAALAGAVGWASPAEIDEHGIMPALTTAALRALEGLGVEADAIVLDGDVDVLTAALATPERPAPLVHLQVAADRDCASVAAASILAKVARDAHMVALHAEAPEYGWASNKGYGSAVHREAIDRLGVHVHHRRSWRLGSRPAPARPVVTAGAAAPGLAVPGDAERAGAVPGPAATGSAAPGPAASGSAVPGSAEPGVLWDDHGIWQERKEPQ